MTSVTIHDSVTSIGDEAFYKCSGLTLATIPASVTSIGSSAFNNCDNLTDFVSLIQEPFKVSNIVSDFIYKNGTLYVPEGTMGKYKATNGWKNFVWMEEGNPLGIKLTNSDGSNATEVQRYTIGGDPAVCYEGIHGYNSEMQDENVKILHIRNSLIISGQKVLESNEDLSRVKKRNDYSSQNK